VTTNQLYELGLKLFQVIRLRLAVNSTTSLTLRSDWTSCPCRLLWPILETLIKNWSKSRTMKSLQLQTH